MKRKKKPKQRLSASKKDRSKRESARPKNFKEHLLAIPRGGGEFERMETQLRDVDFGDP